MPLLSLRTMALRECLGRIDPDGLRLLVVLRCCAEALSSWSADGVQSTLTLYWTVRGWLGSGFLSQI